MTQIEQQEIRTLPDKYRPLSAWAYFGYNILYSLPIIGFIMLIVHALSDSNINRRSFARSFFCVYVIAAIIVIISLASGIGAAIFGNIMSK